MKKEKIKVLQYAPGFLSGGIESRMLDWYRNINRDEIQFVLIKLNMIDNTPNMEEFINLGGKYFNLPPFGFKSLYSFEKNIKNIIKQEQIDIVHVHDPASGFFVLKAAKDCGIPCRIFHSRTTSFLPNERNLIIKKILKSQVNRYATDFFACSYEAGIWACGPKHKDEIVVIKNGVQHELFEFNQKKRDEIRSELCIEDKKVIGTIGRISPQKNLPFLLEVAKELFNIDDSFVLLIVGDGKRSIIEDFCKIYPEVSNKVIIVGEKKNVWDYYMALDVFCGASLYEGFGTTAIESQATGLPTIISTGFPKVVEITSFIRRLDITNIRLWVDEIQKLIGNRYPTEGIKSVIENGYSASEVAKELENFYKLHLKN